MYDYNVMFLKQHLNSKIMNLIIYVINLLMSHADTNNNGNLHQLHQHEILALHALSFSLVQI
jgi:hypothetical protein